MEIRPGLGDIPQAGHLEDMLVGIATGDVITTQIGFLDGRTPVGEIIAHHPQAGVEIAAEIEDLQFNDTLAQEAILQSLEATLQDLQAAETAEEALSVLAEGQAELRSLISPDSQAALEALAQAGQALSQSANADLAAAGEALSEGDLSAAAQALEGIDPSQLSVEELAQLSQDLAAAAQALGSSQPATAAALQNAANALQAAASGNSVQAAQAMQAAGNLRAKKRVAYVREILDQIGIGGERVVMYNLSAGQGPRFAEIAREIGDLQGEGEAMGSIGIVYNALGDSQRALEHHTKYLSIAQTIGDQRGQATALGNIGASLERLGDYDQALAQYARQLNLAREIQDLRREAGAAGGIGNVYREKSKIPQAMDQYQHQLRLARASGDNRLIGTALYNQALCHGLQGEIDQAIALAEESLQSLEQVEGTLPGMIRENLEKWKAEFQPD